MNIIPLLMFCSLVLVAGSILMFVWSSKQGDCHHADRLCLLPLEDDDPRPAQPATPAEGAAPARQTPTPPEAPPA